MKWSGRTLLIWDPDEVETHYEHPKNAYCHFRKTFILPEAPIQATIKLFADSRYALYVNGRYVGRGPCRSDPRMPYCDEWDILDELRSGTNVIAVLALHYGYGTGQSVHRIPALIAEADIRAGTIEPIVVPSDASWRCLPAPAYDRDAPRVNGCQGPIEIYDARLEPAGWTEPDFDDGAWKKAKGRGAVLSPFWNWKVREIPNLEEGVAEARAIVNFGYAKQVAEPVQRLHRQIFAEEALIRLTGGRVEDGIADYKVEPDPEEGQASIVTFEFPVMEAGYLQLDVTGSAGTVIDAVYAEELWEGKALINVDYSRPIDRFVLAEGRNRLENAFAWRAFRYVQFRVRGANGPVAFHRVGMRTRRYPMARTASMHSGDDRLNGIWDISVRTLRICMQDGFLDSSSREQQQWMGDGRWQAVFNAYLSGDSRLHRKLLEQIGQSQDWQGMTKARYPDGHHNYPPIPSFCLAWISAFADYRTYAGDDGFVRAWWPNIVLALRWFAALENEDGLLEDVPYWAFIDWAEGPKGPLLDDQRGGIVAPLNLQYLEALQSACSYAELAGDPEAMRLYSDKALRLGSAIRSQLWDEEKGAYVDSKVDGHLSATVSEPTNALALLHLHEADDERAREIYRTVFSPDTNVRTVAGSPYFMLTTCRALRKVGAVPRALEMIRSRYGAMLDAGSTTTWEKWTLFHQEEDGRVAFSSASHAWGAAPIAFAFEGLFGLRPLEPGFRRFSLDPALGAIANVRAALPTDCGELRLELRQVGEREWELEADVPKGSVGQFRDMTLTEGHHVLSIGGER
ncbi:family 78 glycoside hydrolase catalytic domain [Cohnella sp. GCM10027633]|uniref:family 78 glycoside hydrolase catalytic domain n=1 Tax=unclassified Cohnella TaxID=2636738 RepID=UPI00362D275F